VEHLAGPKHEDFGRVRRKIEPMAAQFQSDETSGRNPLVSVEEDAAALQELVRHVQMTRPIQAGEQETLLERAALGDRPSEDRLVAGHFAMVIRLAGLRGEQGLSVADLVQEGSIGLVEAVREFAGSSERDFARFAEAKIAAHMDAAIATEATAVRDVHLLVNAATDYERTEILMSYELGRPPTEPELAEKLEWSIDRTRYVAQVVADARRRHDEELLAFIDPDAIDLDDDDERAEFGE
jgi:DNA-directed RNA polymerase sigma subunit (sigma70/sigma32)